MKVLDNVSHRAISFALEDGKPLYLLAISRANGGMASHILNTAVFTLQEPTVKFPRREEEAVLFECLFHVLLITKPHEGEPMDATPAFEEVCVLDVLCPTKTDTTLTLRFRPTGKGSSFSIVRRQ